MRKPIIAGNWKMHKTLTEAIQFIDDIRDNPSINEKVEAVVCSPALFLHPLVEQTKDTYIKIGAQNAHYEDQGAFTGEISPAALADLSVSYVIIGHSERREYFAETDESVNKKVHAACKHGLIPIMCCGESDAQHESGQTNTVVEAQVTKGLQGLTKDQVKDIVIAYEPIWAIGTGKSSSAKDANEVCQMIRNVIAQNYSQEVADAVRILYGGSVNPNNIGEFIGEDHIDGALVGGASLDSSSFVALLEASQ